MLRYGFLPSDFHPQFLILGERDDIVAFAHTLGRFAEVHERVEVENGSARDGGSSARLVLSPSDISSGLRQTDVPGAFAWELDRVGASTFVDMIQEMLAVPQPAGSTILEVAGSPNIPVKISYGEFTEDFLISAF